MTASIVAGAIAIGIAVDGIRDWRRGRRVIAALSGLVSTLCACVAVRDLPGPLVTGLIVAVLLAVAVVTAWPLLRPRPRPGPAGSEERASGDVRDGGGS